MTPTPETLRADLKARIPRKESVHLDESGKAVNARLREIDALLHSKGLDLPTLLFIKKELDSLIARYEAWLIQREAYYRSH